MDDTRRSLLPLNAAGVSPAPAAGACSSANSTVAQPVERAPVKGDVAGSTPARGAKGSRKRKRIAALRQELRREQYAENKAWRRMKVTHAITDDYGDSSVIDQWYAHAMAIRHIKNHIKALCESPTERRKRMT